MRSAAFLRQSRVRVHALVSRASVEGSVRGSSLAQSSHFSSRVPRLVTLRASQLDDVGTSFSSPAGRDRPSARSLTGAAGEADSAHWARKKVIFILGGPGAGKGTQCEKISREFGLVHLSAGDLLRTERASGSENGQLIESLISEGCIVPVAITLGLLRAAMAASPSSRFLIDGFPRNWDNVQGWDEHMEGSCDVEAVWFIDCDEGELEKRLLERGKTSGRSDDNVAAAKKRFVTYRESTLPIVEHFRGLGKVVSVRGDQPVEFVYGELRASLLLDLEKEVMGRNTLLLQALAANDWPAYKRLCRPSLTAFESRVDGALIEGLDYHEFGFAAGAGSGTGEGSVGEAVGACGHTITVGPHVRVIGRSAIVSYTRQGGDQALEETRVWETFDGKWYQVHFHSALVPK